MPPREEWINQKERFKPEKSSLIPPIDYVVSKAIGRTVYAHDPRLLKLVVKWKREKNNDETMDFFLNDPKKIAELIKVFG